MILKELTGTIGSHGTSLMKKATLETKEENSRSIQLHSWPSHCSLSFRVYHKMCPTRSSDQCLVPSWQHYIERFWKLYALKPGWRKYVTEGIFWRIYLVPWDFFPFCFPFVMMWTTFATCSCGHDGLPSSRPRNIEPIEHGLNPLKLWATPPHLSCLCQISCRLMEKSN